MASGSRGRGRGRGSSSPARAGAGTPDDALPLTSPQLAGLPAADLVAHLNRHRRGSDFVDAALVLAARERRLAEAEARIRAADEVAGSLRDEIRARELSAAEVEAQIRRAAETEARLQAEIGAWERRAAEAEGRLRAETGVRDRTVASEIEAEFGARDCTASEGVCFDAGLQATLADDEGTEVGDVYVPDLTGREADAQAKECRRDEAPEVVSGKRKESAAASEDNVADEDDDTTTLKQRFKKLKLRVDGCSDSESDSESNTGNEDALAITPVALAIVPHGSDLPETLIEIGIGDASEATTSVSAQERRAGGSEPEHCDIDMVREGDYESDYQLSPAKGNDLPAESLPEVGGGLEVGEHEPEDPKMVFSLVQKRGSGGEPWEDGDEDMAMDKESETNNNLLALALAVVSRGNDLPLEDGPDARTRQGGGGQEPDEARRAGVYARRRGYDGGEPNNGIRDMSRAMALESTPSPGSASKGSSQVDGNGGSASDTEGSPAAAHSGARNIVSEVRQSTVPMRATNEPRKKGMFYKMVFKVLKEKEIQRTGKPEPATATATASQPNLRCWLYAPLPSELVVVEEGSDREAPQK